MSSNDGDLYGLASSSDSADNLDNIVKLDVGGQKFKLPKSELQKIPYFDRLLSSGQPRKKYFIDRDPQIFSMILDQKGVVDVNVKNKKYLADFINYGLVEVQPNWNPKIKLMGQGSLDQDNSVVTIEMGGKKFRTYRSTLRRAEFFKKFLEDASCQKMTLSYDPAAFSQVLNLLRNGQLYYFPQKYFRDLDHYGIMYCLPQEQNKRGYLDDTYGHESVDREAGTAQITSTKMIYQNSNIMEFLKNRVVTPQYRPGSKEELHTIGNSEQYFSISASQTMGHVVTGSQIVSYVEEEVDVNFGKTIVFDLPSKYGELIEDVLVVLELGGLVQGNYWVNKLSNILLKKCWLAIDGEPVVTVYGEYLDLYEKTFLGTGKGYERMNFVYESVEEAQRRSVQDLRLLIPLYMIWDRKNCVPVVKEQFKMQIFVELQEKHRCSQNMERGGEMKNCHLLVNYARPQSVEAKFIAASQGLYMYNNVERIYQNISTSEVSPHFYQTVIPLVNFRFSKDLMIVIHHEDDLADGRYFEYYPGLLDAELLITLPEGKILTHWKYDNLMLGTYLPNKYLGQVPKSDGIYYCSFSPDPRSNKMLGGLNCSSSGPLEVNLVVRTQKIKGVIHVYSNNYSSTIL